MSHLRSVSQQLIVRRCDYAIACVNEAAAASAARAGRVPTQALPKPRLTDSSWRSMFDRHVRWKAWTVDRLGGGYTPRG